MFRIGLVFCLFWGLPSLAEDEDIKAVQAFAQRVTEAQTQSPTVKVRTVIKNFEALAIPTSPSGPMRKALGQVQEALVGLIKKKEIDIEDALLPTLVKAGFTGTLIEERTIDSLNRQRSQGFWEDSVSALTLLGRISDSGLQRLISICGTHARIRNRVHSIELVAALLASTPDQGHERLTRLNLWQRYRDSVLAMSEKTRSKILEKSKGGEKPKRLERQQQRLEKAVRWIHTTDPAWQTSIDSQLGALGATPSASAMEALFARMHEFTPQHWVTLHSLQLTKSGLGDAPHSQLKEALNSHIPNLVRNILQGGHKLDDETIVQACAAFLGALPQE